MTILGTPAEIYNFGTQYWVMTLATIAGGFVIAIVYLPVFTTLRFSSVYEVRSGSFAYVRLFFYLQA